MKGLAAVAMTKSCRNERLNPQTLHGVRHLIKEEVNSNYFRFEGKYNTRVAYCTARYFDIFIVLLKRAQREEHEQT